MKELYLLIRKMKEGKFNYIYLSDKTYSRYSFIIDLAWKYLNKNNHYNRTVIYRNMLVNETMQKMVVIGLKNFGDNVQRRSKLYANKAKQKENWCIYCDTKLTQENFSIEHIIPLSEKGTNSQVNLVPACKSCNNDRDTEDFYTYLFRVKPEKKTDPYI